ncbi:HB24 protein, partial [Campylorhamphus procurvoides]|nr:HB24 protein [Campylorhamphus procurvoides]
GTKPDLSPAHSGVFQEMAKGECHFINGTDRVRYLLRYFYNWQQYVHFDSDVGHFVGEIQARYWNSDPKRLEYRRAEVDRYCQHNYKCFSPFLVNRRVPPSSSQ